MKRVLLFGYSGHGKTTFLNRLDQGAFTTQHRPFGSAVVRTLHGIEWIDYPGLGIYSLKHSAGTGVLGRIDAIVLVYLLGSPTKARAKQVKALETLVREAFGSEVPVMAIGTASDVRHRPAKDTALPSIAVSSKTGHNMEQALELVRQVSGSHRYNLRPRPHRN